MEFTDAQLAQQPVGYWTGAVRAAVVQYINGRLGELGLTQPHWWSIYQLGESRSRLTRDELLERVSRQRPYVDVSTLGPAVDDLLGSEQLRVDEAGRLSLTETGTALRDRVLALLPEVRAQIHDGISEEDYVFVVKVLRRMLGNIGGDTGFDQAL
ncbi:MarR family winged helix-turn-helix transcriptional regulator [Streptomyces beihaiensis]|uniref:MarR family winged helix-turn-helix transcriptional regulator n=1 Tax=Streptomyces beihaiensis TaxID=2984495 RepID=A0ABT3TYL3_9ACTN|nr:MarR family winged helix-turn-helix transcriptional regulator [Streptomyces beihaiensis]MCX3062138.1 MarR family winged helix-turn-helix transcriptional regulator [Streptomyces beihaiensis]